MVWKAKTSLAELLRRRKQTLQEWMSQTGIANLDELRVWCETNDAVIDIELPKPSKRAQEMTKKLQEAAKAEVKEHHDAGRSVAVWKDGKVVEIPPPQDQKMVEAAANIEDAAVKLEKKNHKTPKKEDNDPSSGTT